MTDQAAQRQEDLRVLRDILMDEQDERVPAAFMDMQLRLEASVWPLSAKQRKWVNDVARRLGVEPSDGPEADGEAEDTRFTSGAVPRGREVSSMVGALPKRPPGRSA